jgi:PAS domain S-box-containing protein
MQLIPVPARRSTGLRYAVGAGCAALAVVARAALDPLLHDQLPFVALFAGIAAAGSFGGLGPALLSAALGYVATELFRVHHGPAQWIATPANLAVTGSYFLAASIIAFISQEMHKARDSAIARQIELERGMGERVQVEGALRESRVEMEAQVRRRTAELNGALEAREHDIIELRQAHAKLSEQTALLQLAQDAILVTDLQGTISFWNRGGENLYGWLMEDAVGENVNELLQPNFPIPLVEIVALVEDQGHWEGEITHRTRSGCAVTVASRWSLERDDEGKPSRVLEVNRDITERKRAEEALEASIKELARSNAELQQFAYVASHDLQEPLRMVANFTQLLAERYGDKVDQDARDFMGYAVEGATRMQTLIEDLLALSRVGTQGKKFAPVRLDDALGGAVANLEFAIRESGALVSHDELPVVEADFFQMVRLLQNLIGNGIKFNSGEPPRIHISAARTGNEWTFSVRDNGIGFAPQYAERIFTIFQRLQARGKYPGTGMGLAICRKIAERHHGRIWAESQPGSGSTFYFTIPAANPAKLLEKEVGVV